MASKAPLTLLALADEGIEEDSQMTAYGTTLTKAIGQSMSALPE